MSQDSSSQAAQIVERWTKNHLGHEVEQLDTLRYLITTALTTAHQQGRVEERTIIADGLRIMADATYVDQTDENLRGKSIAYQWADAIGRGHCSMLHDDAIRGRE